MEHYQSEYGRDKTTDEIRRSEDPVNHGLTEATGIHDTKTGYGTHGMATGPTGFAATTAGGHGFPNHRSDISSSSEDDGYGGRRERKGLKEKMPGGTHRSDDPYDTTPITTPYGGQHQDKGVMDKLKEKLPGGHKDDPHSTTHTTTTPGYGVAGEHHENKGVVDKIKEKLPGGHKDDPYSTTDTTTTPGYGVAGEHHENKGLKEKIEKLPGGNSDHSGTTNTPPFDTRAHEKKGLMDKIKEKLPGHH
ncbi:dehydrin Xero 1 [Rosa chinensis]|uniref:dehydrin Xero 1 n=1 Tax=Rosa chinensis TaxID=74649 RepID=UPI000D08EC4D|nr:dehydrin Xero 1 [Rosa chinensis]